MKCKTAISFLLVFFVTVSFAHAGEWVTFKGHTKTGDELTLKGILNRPQGQVPFPAVVMLHGCSGIEGMRKYLDIWAQRLASWGYASLMVDSLTPRGESDICAGDRPFLIPPQLRAQDAHDAKSYLAGLPFVNRDQIALMGWSHGGWTTLFAIDETTYIRDRGDPFRLAIAFYPYCSIPLRNLDAPLLILIGELDDWTPAGMCQLRMPSGKTTRETTLKVYPHAYHGFDFEGMDSSKEGHRLRYDPAATADAVEQVKNFLAKYAK
jgi:dienelactone hydrolase